MSKINVAGAACIDIIMRGVEKERFFSGSYKIPYVSYAFGGDALNQSIVLKHFGNDVRLLTNAGTDPFGKLLKQHLEEKGILFNENMLKEGISTYLSFVTVDSDGERSFTGSENGSLRLLEKEDITVDEDCRIFSFASLFISKKLNDSKLTGLFQSVKKKDILICVDCSTPKNQESYADLNCLRHVDYFFCNALEAKLLCGCEDLFTCEKRLYTAGSRNVIIKCGKDGCICNGRCYPADPVECLDSTGAGDSFVAGFIDALAKNRNIEECIAQANRFGSKACRHIGATAWLDHEKG